MLALALLLATSSSSRADTEDPVIRDAFEKGTLAEGQRTLEAALASAPAADTPENLQRRYALGIVQFLRAGERLGQTWRHFGLRTDGPARELPFLRLPVGTPDPTAAPVTYEDIRTAFVTFLADLKTAEATLAALPPDPGKVPVRFGLVRLDYAGNGKRADTEALWLTWQRLNPGAEEITEATARDFLIKFDAGDVPWFRGYCHLLSGLAEIVLAYDESRLFDHTAQLYFLHPKTPFPFLRANIPGPSDFDFGNIADFIATIHLMNFHVREPARLASALEHLTQIPELSRESWRRIGAETDDDHEWIPNPRQKGVLPGMQVTQEMIDAWLKMLDEVDAILAGRKLLPFWRGGAHERRGVNLRRFFTEPTDFDLVLWVQGPQAVPYLEQGTVTDARLWSEINTAFGGEALGFALYFN